MSRGEFNWLLTIPKLALFAEQHAVFGGPNCTRLKVLKNSVRNCNPSLSSGPKLVVLNIAMSQLLIPCPRKVGIDTTLVPKTPVGRRREAARIEPGDSSREGCMGHGFVASGDIIRTQNTDSEVSR